MPGFDGQFVVTRCARDRARAFTIVELVAALAIMSVLALATVPMARYEAQRARERDLRAALEKRGFQVTDAVDLTLAQAPPGH